MIELVFGDAFNGGLAVDLLSAISSPPSACKQSPSSDTVTMYQGTIFDFLIEYPIMALEPSRIGPEWGAVSAHGARQWPGISRIALKTPFVCEFVKFLATVCVLRVHFRGLRNFSAQAELF